MNFEKPGQGKEKERKLKNILEDFDETFAAIMAVEKELDSHVDDDEISIRMQRSALQNTLREAVEDIRERRELLLKKGKTESDLVRDASDGFEGFGGFNRYTILGDGLVRLYASHSTGPCMQKAKEVGILVQDLHEREEWMGPCPCGSGKEFRRCHGA